VPEDGTRVLVDRVWPRGLRKAAAHLDDWAKDVAPSRALRMWYGHDPAKFGEFRRRYTAELAQPGPRAAFGRLRALAAKGPVTLLTATRGHRHQPGSGPGAAPPGQRVADPGPALCKPLRASSGPCHHA
jgi:uncharacterized protein YeaO (DUF488 family)